MASCNKQLRNGKKFDVKMLTVALMRLFDIFWHFLNPFNFTSPRKKTNKKINDQNEIYGITV